MTFLDSFDNRKQSEQRDFEASAIIGDKRQGKTTLVKLLIEHYISLYPHRRVLVYDISDAFGPDSRSGFKGYEKLSLSELYFGKRVKGGRRKWLSGIRRVGSGYDYEQVLTYMADHFLNGLIVIDEATTIMTDNPSDKRKAVMITHTNRGVDIYMIFHALAYVPKRLRGNFWNYYFFKTPDQVSDWKDIQRMAFPNPKAFFESWHRSQKAPHRADQIMQYFTCFSRNFQHKQ